MIHNSKTITTTFFSTLDREQTIDCLKFLLLPWKWKDWKNGKYIKQAEDELQKYLNDMPQFPACALPAQAGGRSAGDCGAERAAKKVFSFYNGRTALYYALKFAGVGEGDEVIIQAYTCASVPNAIIEAGAKPIYCDIDESLNLDPDELAKKITDKTKAVIVQHTFGNPARIDEIKKMCAGKPHPNHHLKGEGDNENIILIEDCAHSLGAKYNNKLVGTFGDISMFSFGRDKVISSVNGGMLCVNNDSVMLKHTIINGGTIKFPPYYVIAQNLLYPILASISLKWYNKGKVGKGIMYAAKKLRLIPSILSEKEKNGCYHPTDKLSKIGILHPLKRAQNDALSMRVAVKKDFFYKMPNVLAYLFLQQFKKLEEYNKHRFEIAEFYNEKLKGTELKFPKVWDKSEPVYLRYTLFAENAEEIIKKACKKNIYLGDWYRNVIAPKGVNLAGVFYEQNTCSKAEKYALQSVNLPNHSGISLEDAGRAAVEIRELDN